MSRISRKFQKIKKEKRKALIPFITAGDPSLAQTERMVLILEEAGADVIELGVPFSDPMADGPVIQAASERALKKGVTLNDVLRLVKRLRQKTQIPILLMGYYNPVFVMGHEMFARKAMESGVDGLIIVDLPPEEAGPLKKALCKRKIDLIFLLAPTSDSCRIRQVGRMASGFVYYVSLTGITGAKLRVTQELHQQVRRIRKSIKLPVVVGFGISSPSEARDVSRHADGVVVGSSLVRLFARGERSQSRRLKVYNFVSSLRLALDRG